MKKIISLSTLLLSAFCSFAQLPAGSLAPNFTFRPIGDTLQTLNHYLDSGKTVFLFVAPTWSHQAWTYHQSRQLDTLYNLHGPVNKPGVDPLTTNDVMVFYVQSEPTNTWAQLVDTGNSTLGSANIETPYATCTQGDWLAGTYYPTIDTMSYNNTFLSQWHVNYYPTVYMICRDRLVYALPSPTYTQAYQAVLAGCPSAAPTAVKDAKVLPYNGADYFLCTPTPTVRFQNYTTGGVASNITAATIKIFSNVTQVGTFNWTAGSSPVTSYNIATVNIPASAFTAPSLPLGPYKFTVTVAGDVNPTNDASPDSLFKIYAPNNAVNLTGNVETFHGALPFRYTMTDDGSVLVASNSSQFAGTNTPQNVIGYNHQADTALAFDFYHFTNPASEFVYGYYNTAKDNALSLQFDLAYAQYDASSQDSLSVMMSYNCGTTWNEIWTNGGYSLATTTPRDSLFIPKASDWWHISIPMTSTIDTSVSNTVFIKFRGISAHGNAAYVDNINLSTTSSVIDINHNIVSAVSMYPNPAMEQTTLRVTLDQATEVHVSVYDVMGRTVYSTNNAMNTGANTVSIPTATFAAGTYLVKVQAGQDVSNHRLSVIK
ncbi:MAG: T9SS type A sorting domain-containing protein [Bacteroidota bacterium]